MPQKTFKLNDTVKWTSTSSGYAKTKQGDIRAIVPAGVSGTLVIEKLVAENNAVKKMATGWPARMAYKVSRRTESYVVKVPNAKRGWVYYWPLVSKLQLIPKLTPDVVHAEAAPC